MKPVRDPHKFCPICGYRWGKSEGPVGGQHRCPEATLRGIDAAHRREPDEEEPRTRTEADRLNEGLRMRKWGESDDPKTW